MEGVIDPSGHFVRLCRVDVTDKPIQLFILPLGPFSQVLSMTLHGAQEIETSHPGCVHALHKNASRHGCECTPGLFSTCCLIVSLAPLTSRIRTIHIHVLLVLGPDMGRERQ